jgi:hypothetical protein
MNFGRVSDNAGLFRHCVYPNAFKGRVFLPEKLWYFKEEGGSLYGSLAWDRYLPAIPDVHAYGCRFAFGMNAKKAKDGQLKAKDRLFYCGAYNIRGRSVRALVRTPGLNQVTAADVFHLVEEGQIAHVALKISTVPDDPHHEGTKTAIVDRLWNSCLGPLRHICTDDRDVAPHPSAQLLDAPLGVFVWQPNKWLRGFLVFRARVFTWIWLNSILNPPASTDRSKVLLHAFRYHFCRVLWKYVGPPNVHTS